VSLRLALFSFLLFLAGLFKRKCRVSLVLSLVLVVIPTSILAQNPPASDQTALTLAAQAVAALTGGNSISDVTLSASVISVFGSAYDDGTGTFVAKGTGESRIDLSLSSSGTRSDVRNTANGTPAGAWAKNGGASTAYAAHNCWTDAAWFFPALSSLTQTTNSNFIFRYIGREQHGGVNTQHIQVYQLGQFQAVSTMDFYLDPTSYVPLSVAFNLHPDDDMSRNIPVEALFANYRPVNGFQVPFHFQETLNGSMVLDVTVTNATFNIGVSDGIFSLQ